MRTDGFALSVVHADDAVLVLDKPAGLLSVPGRGDDKQDCLSSRAQKQYPDALVVHRLDMSTSGLMLMARGKSMQSLLNAAFAQRAVHKRYLALVHGHLETSDAWRDIDLPIAVDWPNRPRRIVPSHGGKPSLTRWRVIGYHGVHTTRVELVPITGRSHQLRVHMQAIGHSIIGDALYGDHSVEAAPARLMLHATQIAFVHPASCRPVEFTSAPDF